MELKYLLFGWSINLFDINDFKRNSCSRLGQRDFGREMFLRGEHFMGSSTKTAYSINFKLCTHVFHRLLRKTVPMLFLIMNHSFFIAITRRALKVYFAGTVLFVYVSEKNLLKTAILLVQELRIKEEQLVFGPTLTLILPIFGERNGGKLSILKKVSFIRDIIRICI